VKSMTPEQKLISLKDIAESLITKVAIAKSEKAKIIKNLQKRHNIKTIDAAIARADEISEQLPELEKSLSTLVDDIELRLKRIEDEQ